MAQPKQFGGQINRRKFTCLFYHLLQEQWHHAESRSTSCVQITKRHLLDVKWLVMKMDATSLIQLHGDFDLAIVKVNAISSELSALQVIIARLTSTLIVSGMQLYAHLHIFLSSCVKPEWYMNGKAKNDFEKALSHFRLDVFQGKLQYYVLQSTMDSRHEIARNEFSINCLLMHPKEPKQVVTVSSSGGEIAVWDVDTDKIIYKLADIENPRDIVFLSQFRAVVLCDRELKTVNLHSCQQESSIRGMLNIKMPYFQVRDENTVVVLARNRMSVNVVDVNTNKLHATFKAGEDRFLNSLLVSGDGSILVCGDETQKPFPLLIWHLHQCKLLHDIRMPQYDFITNIAAITHNGQFLACGCRVSNQTLSISYLPF